MEHREYNVLGCLIYLISAFLHAITVLERLVLLGYMRMSLWQSFGQYPIITTIFSLYVPCMLLTLSCFHRQVRPWQYCALGLVSLVPLFVISNRIYFGGLYHFLDLGLTSLVIVGAFLPMDHYQSRWFRPVSLIYSGQPAVSKEGSKV
jgi:hypothetical protein